VGALRWSLVTIWCAMRSAVAVLSSEVGVSTMYSGMVGSFRLARRRGAAWPVTHFDARVGADRHDELQHSIFAYTCNELGIECGVVAHVLADQHRSGRPRTRIQNPHPHR
jgi:hypothetical protein